ncbi:MAG: hypothetical protein KQ78_01473 [Candidatus Izimaplasma bacterium HR2]|nr:MAG: hypothetical protein KQ78_01473 [Candidatus Izimaplasma bacterium HR2]
MNINVENLQKIIKKATLNYVVPSVQLKVDGRNIISRMRSQNNTVVICLNIPNDIISEVPDEIEFNFDEPNVKVKPYLTLIDSEVVDAIITDDKLTLKNGRHKTNLHFCMSSFVTTFTGAEPNSPSFYELDLTTEVSECFEKIRKVAGKFEKVYFTVRDGKFILETTDRTNRFANGISFELDSIDHNNIDICFEFKNFNAVLQCLGGSMSDFTAKFTWIESQNAGMVLFEKNDSSEKYYLLSKLEE